MAFAARQGGPGLPGDALLSYTGVLLASSLNASEWEFYVPDHRGTGRSLQLTCADGSHHSVPSQECYDAYVSARPNVLPHMSVAAAAQDTYAAVNALGHGPNNTYIYGVSYGTNLLLKYLTLAPGLSQGENVAGAVLDSVAPTFYGYSRYGELSNLVFMEWADRCGLNSDVCNKCVGPNPVEAIDTVYQELYYGVNRCANRLSAALGTDIDAATLRHVVSTLLPDAAQRHLMLPFLYRFRYCRERDYEELLYGLSQGISDDNDGDRRRLQESGDPGVNQAEGGGDSQLLYFNVLMAELYAPDMSAAPTPDELAARAKNTIAGFDTAEVFGSLFEFWAPQYQVPLADALAMPRLNSTALLLLAGTLDPQTVADGASYAFDKSVAPHKEVWYFDSVVHASLASTPEVGVVDVLTNGTCAGRIVAAFVDSGSGEAAADECMPHVAGPDWDGTQTETRELALELFGTEEVWGSCAEVVLPQFEPGGVQTDDDDADWQVELGGADVASSTGT